MSRFDCRHSSTSDRSRKYQPLPTMPCSRGAAREQRRLYRAGDGGQHRCRLRREAFLREAAQVRRARQQARRQAHDVEDDSGFCAERRAHRISAAIP